MDELSKVVLNALIGAITGTLTAFLTANFRFQELNKQAGLKLKELDKQFQLQAKEFEKRFELQQTVEKESEKSKIRIKYLNPLRINAQDLYERMSEISKQLENPEKINILEYNFGKIKENDINNKESFASWCNGDGYYYVSTLYITNVYFSSASKIRFELPFIQLSPDDDQALLTYLQKVRKAFGGEYGIWEIIQDSLGDYIKEQDGSIMNYKEFCQELIDKNKYIWFLNLIDFYRDIKDKKNHEVEKVKTELSNLINFLEKVSTPH